MATGDNSKRMYRDNWTLLKSVIGKHLKVWVTSVDGDVGFDLRAKQGGLDLDESKIERIGNGIYLPKNHTWPTGGIWIRLGGGPENEKITVSYSWSSGQDAEPDPATF